MRILVALLAAVPLAACGGNAAIERPHPRDEVPAPPGETPEPTAPEAPAPPEVAAQYPQDSRRHITFRVPDAELRRRVQSAADRWYALTGLMIDVGADVGAHVVTWREQEDMPPHPDVVLLGHTGGRWAAARISISRACAREIVIDVIAHELWHVLARENGHASGLVGPTEPADGIDRRLHDDAVEAVCRVQRCAWFASE